MFPYSFDEMKTEELESELCSQAAHLSVGECHLVLLIAEFDRREAWGGVGLRSCAHWLNWRLGTSLGAAREQVRVGRALKQLPCTRAAFSSGELSYSKVRAITRVADPSFEENLVDMARHATASQLERIVREYRRADPEEQEKANLRHLDRYLRSYTEDDGMVMIKARLSPEDGAIVLAAIEAARQAMAERAEAEKEASAETSTRVVDDPEHSRADALVELCAALLGGGLPDTSEESAVSVIVHIDEEVARDPTAPGCAHTEGVGAITAHSAARLACDASVSKLLFRSDGSVEQIGSTRTIPRKMRRALSARDRQCRFPGCNARRFLHAHHIVYWSRGGPTALSNLVLLCSRHHRLVHEGGWRLSLRRGGALRVFTPAGAEMPAVPEREPAIGPGLAARHEADRLSIDDETLRYNGERFDMTFAIDCLLWSAGKAECFWKDFTDGDDDDGNEGSAA